MLLFWHYLISLEKCGDQPRYPLLTTFMFDMLSLPDSSAAAERIFSSVNAIKVKNRSCLKTSTINSLMHSKLIFQEINCTTWNPEQDLCKKIMEKHWYIQEKAKEVDRIAGLVKFERDVNTFPKTENVEESMELEATENSELEENMEIPVGENEEDESSDEEFSPELLAKNLTEIKNEKENQKVKKKKKKSELKNEK